MKKLIDPNHRTSRFRKVFESVGPGFITAAVVLGPGSIAVASRIGSENGFAFLWVIICAAIAMVVYAAMSARFGVTHEASILQAITKTYGKWFAGLIGIAACLAASSFQFGNNLGVGIALYEITGINEAIWPLIITPLGLILVFWAKKLYQVLEKMMMVIVMIMILAFVTNLIYVRPNMLLVARGFVPSSFSWENWDIIAAMVATTFSLHGAMYQSYLVQDKKWKVEKFHESMRDTYMGIFMLALISILIVITSAAALYPRGIIVNSAGDMAQQLEALFGRGAKIIFCIGLFSAAFSSMMVNAVIGGGLLADGLGLGRQMNEKWPKIFTAMILLLGMAIAVFFRGNVIYALIMAQASSIFAVPLIGIGLLLLSNNKKVMGEYRNSKTQNVLGILGLILISVMVGYMYTRLVGFLGQV